MDEIKPYFDTTAGIFNVSEIEEYMDGVVWEYVKMQMEWYISTFKFVPKYVQYYKDSDEGYIVEVVLKTNNTVDEPLVPFTLAVVFECYLSNSLKNGLKLKMLGITMDGDLWITSVEEEQLMKEHENNVEGKVIYGGGQQ